MPNCANCGKKVAFFGSISDWAGNRFCSEECKSKFKEKKKEQTPEEKRETTITAIILIAGLVLIYFMYKWFIDPLGSILGISTFWKVVLAIIAYLAAMGGALAKIQKQTFFETHRHGIKTKEDATSKIVKLKELKDKGVISKQEFENKKKELLEKI